MSGPRRLGLPLPAVVRADERGRPLAVDGREVEAVRESWLVEDRWWTDEPLRRRYWEVVTSARPVPGRLPRARRDRAGRRLVPPALRIVTFTC